MGTLHGHRQHEQSEARERGTVTMNRWNMLWTWLVLIGLCGVWKAVRAEIPPAQDAPQPLSPEESARCFHLPDGFRIELIASEPLIREPAGVCWDEHGRMFVCELHGYNLEGHYDIEELNQTGQLDRVVRRIQASDKAKQRAEAETSGTVKRLIDDDGDGRMDRVEVWADDLPPCYGMVAARGGLIVVCAPHIVFLADRDGDGHAEVRDILFTGFAEGILERRLNAPQWGLDGWVYVGTGQGGSTVTGPHLKEPVALQHSDLRIRPDGTAIEPVSGTTWGFGFAFTESDLRLVSSISHPATYVVPLPWHYLARNPYLPSPPLNDAPPAERRTYPVSQPHPWRVKRAEDPGFNQYYTERYGIAESAPNGYFTSCCSPLVYLDSALPGLQGHLLACEPAQNLITRMRLIRNGARLLMERVPDEAMSEFLASTDQWFHPIALAHAPDGTIVITDFYREIIEDYSAIPRYLQQQYSLIAGRNHGRLWRLTHDRLKSPVSSSLSEDAPTPSDPNLSRLSDEQLAAEIASPRHWRRQTAHRLLVERQARGVAPQLSRIARESQQVPVVLHALHTLQQLGALRPDDVLSALQSPAVDVRVHALRLAEPWLNEDSPVRRQVLDLARRVVDDFQTSAVPPEEAAQQPEALFRLQLALTLGECSGEDVLPLLARLAVVAGQEPWMTTAIASSLVDRAEPFFGELVTICQAQGQWPESAREMFEVAARIVAARRDQTALARLLERLAALDHVAPALTQRSLKALLQGFEGNSPPPLESRAGQQALGRLLSSQQAATAQQALLLAGLLGLRNSPLMTAAWKTALQTAMDEASPLTAREAAIGLFATAPLEVSRDLLPLLDVRHPLEVQLAVVRTLSATNDPQVVDLLLANLPQLSPDVRVAIVDVLCAHQNRLPKLLDALEQQILQPGDLPALRRVQLLEHADPAVRTRASRLLKPTTSAERSAVLARYQAALKGPRDPVAGKALFEQHCAKCHQLGQQGFAVGPDLDAVLNRPEESWLLDILDPSGTINPKFRTYTVVTKAGRVTSGVLAGESATSITLRREKNETETILRTDIDEWKASAKSLMPEGLEKDLSPQQIANLLAYLQSVRQSTPLRRVLFEDEPAFVQALEEGNGTASLQTEDKFSGDAALHITPLQRYSARIAGWNFRIVERPAASPAGAPEEYRYLRFAWKAIGAAGVMLELADAGQWPPADSPVRRYYAGKNTSGWEAKELAAQPPAEWTVVTVDLWSDFGEFTLTGLAPTALGGAALFDRIELLQSLDTTR